MKLYAIVETNNNRLIAFANALMAIDGCYLIPDVDHDINLIGKRYNNGVWETVSEPISETDKFTSDYAKALGRV